VSNLTERDGEAISRAIKILSEAGYRVSTVGKGAQENHGVSFRLEVHAPSRQRSFEPQSEEVRAAAIEAPEFNMGGNRVEPETERETKGEGGAEAEDG